MVDVEALVIGALLDDPGVISLVGADVHTALPANPRYPVLLAARDGGPVDALGHLDAATLIVEGVAPHREQAYDAAAAALEVIIRLNGTYDEGVVTGTNQVTGLAHLIDPPTGYHRFLFRQQVFVHPHPGLR